MTLSRVTDFLGKDEDLLTLLTQKIKMCSIEEKTICITVDNPFMSYRNKIKIDDYELDATYLYLANDNFEVHIQFDNSTGITYDDFEDCFTIVNNNLEINLYFI